MTENIRKVLFADFAVLLKGNCKYSYDRQMAIKTMEVPGLGVENAVHQLIKNDIRAQLPKDTWTTITGRRMTITAADFAFGDITTTSTASNITWTLR